MLQNNISLIAQYNIIVCTTSTTTTLESDKWTEKTKNNIFSNLKYFIIFSTPP